MSDTRVTRGRTSHTWHMLQVEVLEECISDPTNEFNVAGGSSLRKSATLLSVVHRPSSNASASIESIASSESGSTRAALDVPISMGPSGHVRV